MANIEEKVESLLKPTIENLGYELYDVIYEKEAQDYYLRIFIDTPKGISLKDCEKVNDAISDILDEANYIKDAYFLEVSSPGIERILRKDKHFQDSIDKKVEVNLFSPVLLEQQEIEQDKAKSKNKKSSTTKQLEGILKSFDKEKIILTIEKNKVAKKQRKQEKSEKKELTIELPRKNIANIKIKYEWE